MGRGRSTAALLAIVSLIAAALPLSLVVASATPAGAAFANPVRILPLGDSITKGIGHPSVGGYRDRLENELVNHGKTFKFLGDYQDGPDSLADKHHEGIGGKRIGEMTAMFDLVKSQSPDIVLLIAGTNDMGTGWETAYQRLATLIDTILGYSSVDFVVVGTIPPRVESPGCPAGESLLDPHGVQYNKDIKEKVIPSRSARVRLVDMYPLINKSTDMADCRHPNKAGYEKMGTAWYNQQLAGLLTSTPANTVPTAPTSVSAVAGNGQATISFGPPASNGGAAVTEYTVTSTPGNKTKVGSGSPLTVTGLDNGTNYTFKVKAKNSVGYGPESQASNLVTPTGPPPGDTTYLSDLNASSFTAPFKKDTNAVGGQLRLNNVPYTKGIGVTAFADVTYTLNGQYKSFLVDVGIDDSCTGTNKTGFQIDANGGAIYPTTGGAQIITPTSNTVQLNLDVTGKNTLTLHAVGGGDGIPCDRIDWANARLTTTTSSATAPGPPTIGTVTAGNASATVNWTPPASDGGSPITAYVIYRGNTTANPVGFTGPGSTQALITGLTNGTAYQFTVRAQNNVGLSNPSALSLSVTPTGPAPTVPGAPTNVQATPGNAQATVSFTPPNNGGAQITRYKVYDGGTELNSGTTFTQSPINLTGLVNGQTYNLVVKATNSVGEGQASSPSVPVTPVEPPAPTVPGAPTNVQATPGNAQATVTFTAPANGGTQITRYKVYDGGTELNSGTTFTQSPINLTGLVNGQTYNLVVKATNSVGEGQASSPSVPVTPTAPSGTDVFLGDLTPASSTNPTKVWRNTGINGGVLKILSTTYTKGVQVNGSIAPWFDVTYNLPGSFSLFQSDIGVDATACGQGGTVRFKVFKNGDLTTPIYDSGTTAITGVTSPTTKVNVGLAGVTSLTLRVEKNGGSTCNYSDWADAKLMP